MLICGIKASHDGGVALIDDGRLRFSVEMEKLDNAPRYSALGGLERVPEILAREGVDPEEVDQFVVDGWWTNGVSDPNAVATALGGRSVELPVAPYHEGSGPNAVLERHAFEAYSFNGAGHGYVSYSHVSNHVLGAYCSSPFAARQENALVLVWDGGTVPRLYHVDIWARTIATVSALLPITGNSFADFSANFGPFKGRIDGLSEEELMRQHLAIAGKAMAYAALGTVEESAYPVFDEVLADFSSITSENARQFGEKVASYRREVWPGLSDADLIATYQGYLGSLVTKKLISVLRRRFPQERPNLVLGGGCALNIKWNSLIRSTGMFSEVFAPPFANDSGAAIGTAACEMFRVGGAALDWDVYSGPALREAPLPDGWSGSACDEDRLAWLLHTEQEPVVVLSGRAEIGPRALGNRSILASATSPAMKDRLNAIKNRAAYRPVAPICLAGRASGVFDPGQVDPFMLFEHRLRAGWVQRVPAVVHLDGTARLQTIEAGQNTATARILVAYERLTGIPVLCNTSANLDGCGFFPDVASAARWGGTRYIWCNGTLYRNTAACNDAEGSA